MKYKLLVLDLDNTLLCTDKSISKKNQEAIDKCIENGVMVSLASGRPAADVFWYAKKMGLEESYHVCDNGAGFFRGEDRKITKVFTQDFYSSLIDKLLGSGYECGVFLRDNPDFVYDENCSILTKDMAKYFPVTKVRTGDLKKQKNVYKVCTYFKDDNEFKFVKSLEQEGEMEGVVPDPNLFDMMPYGVTKIEGTKNIANKIGINMDEVIVMGDQHNDLTNIIGAGLGVVVSNAVEELKENADVVLKRSCDEDAVWYTCEKYIFNNKGLD